MTTLLWILLLLAASCALALLVGPMMSLNDRRREQDKARKKTAY